MRTRPVNRIRAIKSACVKAISQKKFITPASHNDRALSAAAPFRQSSNYVLHRPQAVCDAIGHRFANRLLRLFGCHRSPHFRPSRQPPQPGEEQRQPDQREACRH